MTKHSPTVDMRHVDKYVQNDCQRFDGEKMKKEEYFLHGKVVYKDNEHNQDSPANVGKTDGVVVTNKSNPQRSKSIAPGSNHNHSKIILQENEFSHKTNREHEYREINLVSYYVDGGDMDGKSKISQNNVSDRVYQSECVVTQEIIEPTVKDYEDLSINEQLLFDKRPFSIYVKDIIFEEHRVINIVLKKSILVPLYIKINELVFEFSMSLAINALLFSADYIDKRATANDKVLFSLII
jgi:hypothetical protein